MNLQSQPGDAPDFVSVVEHAVNGILRRYSPPTLILVKIDNWFGSRRAALLRKAAVAAPFTALVWYSGNSKTNGRGSLMAHVPVNSFKRPAV
ncbi:MAG TPA: hypothetical protein VGJ21_11360 [Terracidiphilus sp.]